MKLDDQHIENFASYIAKGLTKKDACDAARISRATYYAWIKQGRIDYEEGNHTQQRLLYELVADADCECELSHLNNITAASKSDWHASAWYLERYRGKARPPYKPDEEERERDEMIEIG